MLAGVSYVEMKSLASGLGIEADDKRLWSETGYVRRLLAAHGIETAAEIPFESWEALPDLALLAIKYHLEEGHPCWHWTLFERSLEGAVVFDPAPYLEENCRTDFAAMVPQWFIEIPL